MSSQADKSQLAEHRAGEAERPLARRFGLLHNTLKAQAHATLAAHYCTHAKR
jgi:hypothetical protein